ncbi:uncharacterized protein LOC143292062 [Babylonia areolata]|uniref:uncharacterized protein LOC143292062 n=1 Tax=Babylonia areolata TaxID=304850 RepID=UPI003FD17AC6
MAKRTGLYTACLILFPLAFAAFVVGFGCPVWIANSDINFGLWQTCSRVFIDCGTFDFDEGEDWLIGVRAVEIFALVMLAVAAAQLAYETCCGNFSGRNAAQRVAPGFLCVLGGSGGLAGIIVYAIKTNDGITGDTVYGWALMLVAAGAALAFLLGVGFFVSGCALEKREEDPDKAPINAYGTPYLPSSSQGGDSHEMTAFTNKAGPAREDGAARPYLPGSSNSNPYPGHGMYNGLRDPYAALPYGGRPTGHPSELRSSPYYSYGGDDMQPQYDFSEGYPPSRPRTAEGPGYPLARDDGAYLGGRRDLHPSSRGEDPYLGSRGEPGPSLRGRSVEDSYDRSFYRY